MGGIHDGKELAISMAPRTLYMPDAVPPDPATAAHGEMAAYWFTAPAGILTYHRCGVDGAQRWRYVFGDHGPVCAVKP